MCYLKENINNRILKIIPVLIIMLAGYAPSFAQEVGIEVAYVGTQYKNMSPFVYNNDGFNVGIMYNQPLYKSNTNLKWKTGISYQLLNGKGQVTYTNLIGQPVLSYEKTQELYYLQVPALVQFNMVQLKKIQFFLQAGLYYGYMLRAWHNPQPEGVNHDVTDQFNRHLLAYHVGAGLSLPVNHHYHLQLSYQYAGNFNQVNPSFSGSGFNSHTIQVGFTIPTDKLWGSKKVNQPL